MMDITSRQKTIADFRKNQPIEHLKRKAKKASRKGWWTIEEIEYIQHPDWIKDNPTYAHWIR